MGPLRPTSSVVLCCCDPRLPRPFRCWPGTGSGAHRTRGRWLAVVPLPHHAERVVVVRTASPGIPAGCPLGTGPTAGTATAGGPRGGLRVVLPGTGPTAGTATASGPPGGSGGCPPRNRADGGNRYGERAAGGFRGVVPPGQNYGLPGRWPKATDHG